MNKLFRITGLVAATLLVAGCSLFGDKDEELEPAKLVDIDQVVKVKRAWSAKLGGDSEFLRLALRPTGDGSRIYAASQDGKVSAFDPESGRVLWRTDLEIELTAGPGAGEGNVVVTSQDGMAILLDATDGSEKWRVSIEGESLARPLIREERVVVQTIDNRVQGLSLFDGRSLWSIQQSTPALTVRGSSSPVAIGSTVIAGFDTGRLVAADIDNGEVVWESLLSPPQGRSDLDRLSDIDGELAVVGQDLYASGYQGSLAAIAAESGQVLWSREVSSYEGVSADWNNLYTVDDEGVVIALVRRNGDESWRQNSLLRREPTVPVSYLTTVVVGDLEGYLHFFSNFDGDPVARVRAGSKAISVEPVVVGDRLFVQGDDGSVSAYVIQQPASPGNMPPIADEDT